MVNRYNQFSKYKQKLNNYATMTLFYFTLKCCPTSAVYVVHIFVVLDVKSTDDCFKVIFTQNATLLLLSRASIGGGQHRNCPPTFQPRKIARHVA